MKTPPGPDSQYLTLQMRFEPGSELWFDYPVSRDILYPLIRTPVKYFYFVAESFYGKRGTMYSSRDCQPEQELDESEEFGRTEFFFSSPEEPYYIDVHALDDRHFISSSSSHEPRWSAAHDATAERDGNRCVVTGDPTYEVAHLIPHAKGNAYVSAFHQSRAANGPTRLLPGTEAILGVDDPCNCLCLAPTVHTKYSRSEFAFLRVPNHRMTLDDVNLSDNRNGRAALSCTSSAVIFQDLSDERVPIWQLVDRTAIYLAPAGADPTSRGTLHPVAPDPVLLDAAYADTFARRFGSHNFPYIEPRNFRDYGSITKPKIEAADTYQEEDNVDERPTSSSRSTRHLRTSQACEGLDMMMALQRLARRERLKDSEVTESKIRVQEWLQQTCVQIILRSR